MNAVEPAVPPPPPTRPRPTFFEPPACAYPSAAESIADTEDDDHVVGGPTIAFSRGTAMQPPRAPGLAPTIGRSIMTPVTAPLATTTRRSTSSPLGDTLGAGYSLGGGLNTPASNFGITPLALPQATNTIEMADLAGDLSDAWSDSTATSLAVVPSETDDTELPSPPDGYYDEDLENKSSNTLENRTPNHHQDPMSSCAAGFPHPVDELYQQHPALPDDLRDPLQPQNFRPPQFLTQHNLEAPHLPSIGEVSDLVDSSASQEPKVSMMHCLGRGTFAAAWLVSVENPPASWRIPKSQQGKRTIECVMKIPDGSSQHRQVAMKASEHEGRLLQRLNHPNIVQFVGFNDSSSNLFIEHCAEGDLHDMIERQTAARTKHERRMHRRSHGASMQSLVVMHDPHADVAEDMNIAEASPLCPALDRFEPAHNPPHQVPSRGLEESFVIIVVLQLAEALRYLHVEAGIVHRDVKPKNVFINTEGRLILGDFGVAVETGKPTRDQHTGSLKFPTISAASFVGTASYAAPELFDNQPFDGRVDVWALGCIAYELMSGGVRAFGGNSVPDIICRVCSGDRQRVSPATTGYSARLCDAVERMLEPEAENRPTAEDILNLWSPDEVQDALKRSAFDAMHAAALASPRGFATLGDGCLVSPRAGVGRMNVVHLAASAIPSMSLLPLVHSNGTTATSATDHQSSESQPPGRRVSYPTLQITYDDGAHVLSGGSGSALQPPQRRMLRREVLAQQQIAAERAHQLAMLQNATTSGYIVESPMVPPPAAQIHRATSLKQRRQHLRQTSGGAGSPLLPIESAGGMAEAGPLTHSSSGAAGEPRPPRHHAITWSTEDGADLSSPAAGGGQSRVVQPPAALLPRTPLSPMPAPFNRVRHGGPVPMPRQRTASPTG